MRGRRFNRTYKKPVKKPSNFKQKWSRLPQQDEQIKFQRIINQVKLQKKFLKSRSKYNKDLMEQAMSKPTQTKFRDILTQGQRKYKVQRKHHLPTRTLINKRIKQVEVFQKEPDYDKYIRDINQRIENSKNIEYKDQLEKSLIEQKQLLQDKLIKQRDKLVTFGQTQMKSKKPSPNLPEPTSIPFVRRTKPAQKYNQNLQFTSAPAAPVIDPPNRSETIYQEQETRPFQFRNTYTRDRPPTKSELHFKRAQAYEMYRQRNIKLKRNDKNWYFQE